MKKFLRVEYENQKIHRTKPLPISLSIYATVVAFGIEVYQGIQKLVCGFYPNHALSLPESVEEILDMIDCFKDKDNKQFLPASELKFCTMVLKSCPVGRSPMFYLLAQQ